MKKIQPVNATIVGNWSHYKRDYIWRHKITPYRIMIAEFMLQRTRADQVEPVYKKFLQKYPDVLKLSKARVTTVSRFTESLGLHKRGQNFTNAAKYIVANHKGKFPKERQELLEIPGIGDYVAGAILTACYKKPKYVIDSNIARFIKRYYGLQLTGEIRRKKQVVEISKKIFNYVNTRKLLFAILDFSALICKPINPDHENCVFNKECKYYRKGVTSKTNGTGAKSSLLL